MAHIWIYATILAACFQVSRNSIQKILKRNLDSVSITWARFLFAIPATIILALSIYHYDKTSLINPNNRFLIYCFLGGLTQIIGTILLVNLFSHRNFMIGIAYMKTETMQTAIIGTLFFADKLGYTGIIAIIISTIGLILLSPKKNNKKLSFNLTHKSALIGIACGFFYSLAALYIKKASIFVNTDSNIISAVTTLIYVILIQNIILMIYQIAKNNVKEKIKLMIKEWRLCLTIGTLSILGSICWFYAFTLTSVAHVKVIGQTEIIISFLISHKLFSEKSTKLEIMGILLILSSIILIAIY